MNRVLNNPDFVVEDMLAGWLAAHGDSANPTNNPRVIRRTDAPQRGKVGITTGGGSGHEPAFLGYVGNGLLDSVAVGEVFSSPTAKSFLDAIRAADGGCGVACLYGNYAGDNMNVRMAMQMAEREGIEVRTVVANDDVPSAPKGDEARRRGVAGEILMWKVGAAKAAMGGSLDEVVAAAAKAIANTRSIGIGLSACVIPAVGKANFTIERGTMEVGIGHHGEPGIQVSRTATAAEMAEMMLGAVLPDLPFRAGDRVAVLVSGLGATPLMEQYILYGEIAKRLKAREIEIAFNRVGNLFTSLEMMGVTLTMMRLDEELQACLAEPCCSPSFAVHGPSIRHPEAAARAPERNAKAARSVEEEASPRSNAAPHVVRGASIAMDEAGEIVRDLIAAIVENRQYLSEIDGLIGDGDHGINMAKGFTGCASRLDAIGPRSRSLPAALEQLSQALMDDIGGSMGPLYGTFFLGFVTVLGSHDRLDAALFGKAFKQALDNVSAMGNAQVGDKTLLDTLAPAYASYSEMLASGASFTQCLQAMSAAAAMGRDSTRDLQARIGRSARLGARSIGVLDAGATSCCLILQAISTSLQRRLPH